MASSTTPPNPHRNDRNLLCLCGQKHPYKRCFNLNPNVRPGGWVVRKRDIFEINKKLHTNSFLRKKILDLGYEHYVPEETAQLPDPNPLQQQGGSAEVSKPLPVSATIQSNVIPHFRKVLATPSSPGVSKNPRLQLGNIAYELKVMIVKSVYKLTVEELPACHPCIHSSPTETCSSASQGNHRRGPPAITILRNRKPPANKRAKDRKGWLWHHPGQWGPIFQIMFVNRNFYEIGKPIRYREVHVDASFLAAMGPTRDLFFQRLVQAKDFLMYTQHVNLKIRHIERNDLVEIVEALKSLPKLKHVCITIPGPPFEGNQVSGQDYLIFFNELKLETLTFIWGWRGLQSWLDLPGEEHDEEFAPVRRKAEVTMQHLRNQWMRNVFEQSSWYIGPDQNVPVRDFSLNTTLLISI